MKRLFSIQTKTIFSNVAVRYIGNEMNQTIFHRVFSSGRNFHPITSRKKSEFQCCQISSVPTTNIVEDEASYHKIADISLEYIMDYLSDLENELSDKCDDVDIMYSQGVLTISLKPFGIWVLNKQSPNRQLWWSSPISGPRRYEFVAPANQSLSQIFALNPEEMTSYWIYSRHINSSNENNTNNLLTSLKQEIVSSTNININYKNIN
eukprot:gene9203-12413_t